MPFYPPSSSPSWTLPVAPADNPQMNFAYPSTPLPLQSSYIPPPGQQPMSDLHGLPHPHSDALGLGAGQNHLGFVQLDDWFGTGNLGGGGAGGPANGAVGGDDDGNGGFGALDLQDFWMKVGPGEVSMSFAGSTKLIR